MTLVHACLGKARTMDKFIATPWQLFVNTMHSVDSFGALSITLP